VILYLDSSAVVKLVQRESESNALRRFLRRHTEDRRVTSALTRVEVVRAVAGGGSVAVGHARRQLGRLDQIALHPVVLDAAAALAPGSLLRSLDAIHLASAQMLGTDLRCVVTYDGRMTSAAITLGLAVDAPA
jgi:predicted nucleic acid-binding protein